MDFVLLFFFFLRSDTSLSCILPFTYIDKKFFSCKLFRCTNERPINIFYPSLTSQKFSSNIPCSCYSYNSRSSVSSWVMNFSFWVIPIAQLCYKYEGEMCFYFSVCKNAVFLTGNRKKKSRRKAPSRFLKPNISLILFVVCCCSGWDISETGSSDLGYLIRRVLMRGIYDCLTHLGGCHGTR